MSVLLYARQCQLIAHDTKPLTTHSLYSSKLSELYRKRQELRQSTGDKITPAQHGYLLTLGVPRKEMKSMSKEAASQLISKKLQEREAQPATGPQLKLLEELKYTGTTPATKSKASELIKNIRLAKRVRYLKEKAKRKNTPPALVDKLVSLVKKYGL